MIERVIEKLPPELQAMAQIGRMTLDEDQKVLVDADLTILYDAMIAHDEPRAKAILDKWKVPPECYSMLQMAITMASTGEDS